MLNRLVVATRNRGKVSEIKEILNVEVIPIVELVPDFNVEEKGNTYLENAYLKAKTGFSLIKEPVMAEDSGLEVVALNNEPGILSARYGGLTRDEDKINLLLKELGKRRDRKARFVNVTVLMWESGEGAFFEGICEGSISYIPKGEKGFGYDPIFIPAGYKKTFSELGDEIKNRISHRARALTKLKKFLSYYKGFGE